MGLCGLAGILGRERLLAFSLLVRSTHSLTTSEVKESPLPLSLTRAVICSSNVLFRSVRAILSFSFCAFAFSLSMRFRSFSAASLSPLEVLTFFFGLVFSLPYFFVGSSLVFFPADFCFLLGCSSFQD